MFNFKKESNKDGEIENNKHNQQSKEILQIADQIESILFYKADEVSINFLVKFLGIKKEIISKSINQLRENLNKGPISLVINNEKLNLVIKKEHSDLISELKGEEKSGELSSSALETLSIILYKGPISKSEIDEIRGVNSSYILRNLLVRGLVERKVEKGKTVYTKTLDLMRFLGITDEKDLPGYEKVLDTLNKIEQTDESDVFTQSNKE